MKHTCIFLISIIFILTSKNGLTNHYVECYECSYAAMQSKANTWVYENVGVTSGNPTTLDVHVIDIIKNRVISFKVTKELPLSFTPDKKYYDPSTVFKISSIKADTPTAIKQPMLKYHHAKEAFESASNDLIVPKSILKDAWQFTNCAYCENIAEEFFNNSLKEEILAVKVTLNRLVNSFGLIKTQVSYTYRVPLEAGGYLQFPVILNNLSNKVTSKIDKVVDFDGNTVPFSSDNLKGLLLNISSTNRNNTVKSFIRNFHYTTSATSGHVTIIDCINDTNLDNNQACS